MRPDELKKNIAANIQEVMKKAGAAAVCFGFVTELAEAAFKAIVPEPHSDATAEACTLSALAKHIEVFRQENPSIDPHVLVNVGNQWRSVRANIEATGEHRNAVKIAYLASDPAPASPFATQRKNGNDWETVHSGYLTVDDASLSFADARVFPDPLGCRVIDANGVVVFQ